MPSLEQDYGPLLATLYFQNRGILAQDRECEAAKFHAPKPQVLRLVSLVPWDEKRKDEDTTWVCGICADSLAMYQQFLLHFDGHVPYDITNRFSSVLRRLANRGWRLYKPPSPEHLGSTPG
jgi:hypothetical protein